MAAHQLFVRMYYEDTDAGGVVYHAQYLAFAERARSEALRAAGASAASLAREHGIVFVVRRLEADYVRPLRLDDLVCIETVLLERRGASARLKQILSVEGEHRATLTVQLAFMRMSDGKPTRLPEPWSGVLDRLA
ncbi:YbgC/FadM family acyl-CoA thioesterase [Acetobacteraceae bacterium KSS8]|uniref:YbgC/FadM family acyl-CoA thioesterase n=1 Tax=Endosaccharibacter trunci TaxID=2812733 RepID=A0ABT1W9U4_9PROT|nr:YbgC/FadM family acyl-CoA thioesterase [Acetobacteraceae bacterium KSS8]